MKIDRLERILKMVTILQSGQTFSADELAEHLSVTRRTVFRDLNMIHAAGIPFFHDKETGGYRMDSSFFLPPLNLKLHEAIALLLLAHEGGASKGLGVSIPARDAAMKIESLLPGHIKRYCSELLRNMSIRFGPHTPHSSRDEVFNVLQKATGQRNKVRITYRSYYEKKSIETELSPYLLHFSQRAWYVIGYSELHDEARIFKVKRIESATPLNKRYLLERPFRLDDYLGKAWSLIPEGKIYHVRILFEPMVAGNVAEVQWHPHQKLTRKDDGRLLFEVEVDGLREIEWWVMGYGDQAKVLAPAALKKRILNMAQNIVAKYEEPTP